jgi:predicted secreted protein
MKTYRIVLIVLLIAAVVGGAWYCMTAGGSSKTPENGTLVEHGMKKSGCQWG